MRFAQRLGRFCTHRCFEFAKQQDAIEGSQFDTAASPAANAARAIGSRSVSGEWSSPAMVDEIHGTVSGEWSAVMDDPLPSGCAIFTSTLPRAIQTARERSRGRCPLGRRDACAPRRENNAYAYA